ncbi:High-affinity glucose transporter [Wickerhamomyces ciferrii]|uniref:High-affinity glucose transporter n=1 Tax=Wickerhamomyces ciferrii (strain ATCC 14091 / BCRC 22168 / CBS 111 / JCM 3599 / NBRC 0793 / NRRL Y-1031 F-60-10) TaxID=1206466 RepID=K0KFD9_WICCF|nr:High-affinity glucose transporter [Wickerhamomyces ciferrii]CCH40942.1 High-affinity glucose transporter [Wickerhamomyces ciferrii]
MGLENNRLVRKYINFDEKTEGSTTLAILIGLFAALGGVLFGYDTGTIVTMPYVLKTFPEDNPGLNGEEGVFSSSEHSLIVSILSVGTFFGALGAPLLSDTIGRRWTLIIGSAIVFNFGIILQTAATNINLLVAGRVFAGLGVGIISACIPLYQAETVPKWIRGAITAVYQFAITIGLFLAAIINQGTHKIDNTASYRVPIAIQFLWSLIITTGMIFLPETPRFYVSKGRNDEAAASLSKIRRLPIDHPALTDELGEIIANFEFENLHGKSGWLDCFKTKNHQLKRLFTGVFIQAFQQLTGINFIFYFGTTFFKNSGIENEFLIQVATNIVNVFMTIPGILLIEVLGRRTLLMIGAAGMCVSELLVAIIGVAASSDSSNKALIAFTCIFISFFASTWGCLAWVVCGEIFPLRTRAKSVAMSVASNWLWNFAIAYATPYLVDDVDGSARLGVKVFFIWGGCNFLCFFFAYFFVYETKGLSLESVDELYETIPRAWQSKGFKPTENKFSKELGHQHGGSVLEAGSGDELAEKAQITNVERLPTGQDSV